MRYLRKYKINEKNLIDAKKELHDFQEELDLDTSIRDLLKSIDALELSIKSIFPFLNDKDMNDVEKLLESEEFVNELEEKMLKPSELFNTEDFNTFAKIPMKWIWIYSEDSTDVEMPVYIMLQHWDEKNWSNSRLFYVQKDINNFLEELSEVTVEIREKDTNQKWLYTTSNSGENWKLQNKEDATETFTINLDWGRIVMLSKHSKMDVVFY